MSGKEHEEAWIWCLLLGSDEETTTGRWFKTWRGNIACPCHMEYEEALLGALPSSLESIFLFLNRSM